MSHYNPAKDPAVINGIQEAYGFKIGDRVEFTNPNGLTFGPRKVVGFVQKPDPDFLPENTVYIDSDSPWYPVKPSSLKKIYQANEAASSKHINPGFRAAFIAHEAHEGKETQS